ncbi:hypothetical protein [Gloeothece verrucosa]|uniref:Uncharacterized protein n=1 Tax=Gloeothece verrucosa (strain PCC 7822) TaxID=497965 RepID=E0UL58_GLOV7|nr:hypothetical protein [Gloeothece verrucosa]ADN17688.1 conserved hypothetical protein [Gloeothece verrucosa PCC 7822]
MQANVTIPSNFISDISELKKGLNRIGVNLSELHLNQLYSGESVSLEHLELSQIGSIFILVSAVSAVHSGRSKQQITFKDLPKSVQECADCSGVPIYCWFRTEHQKSCLYFTLIDGKPAIRACHRVCPKSI